ncbi:cyclic nucleotide-gated cation channel beta-1 isoform X2 [Bicyclus anynana]|uniref:Cyclic nucleotide-gated cation channel beta-1 isoform X2 n=1 Tax=Bicyclus anynana TaxID=110368 RepID=A0A6J1NXK5_BICAN|nr:cyclic nucleotide-gated cation channel beta-1 isoform X2 [Bicyclus anynana]
MEIKVEVHTAKPSASSDEERPACVAQGPCNSWGTPDSTRKHTTSSINPQRVRLQIPNLKSVLKDTSTIEESVTELEDFDEIQIKNYEDREYDTVEKIEEFVESPQSPVPSSPSRDSKCERLKLPSWCDPAVTIDPQGKGYITWLLLATCCYSYNAWCVALRATFPYQTPENTPMWMTADFFCDIIYLLDVVFVKPRLMFLHEGFWVDDPVETRKNYKRKLQYKFDIISLLPLEILYFYFGTQKVILRLPRLLKLQTFWEFHQAIDRVLSSPYVVRIGKMLFYIFYLIHLNACAYYALSDHIGLGSNGWVYDNQGNAYIRCFYFATKTATSIGKNPKPENTKEYLYMTAAWLMGVFVFALLISQIRDIIATASRAQTEYRKSVDGCTRYLRKLNMPASLLSRVTCWFSYTWSQQRCFDESKILNFLPSNMKQDVALEVHIKTLSKVQLFRDCSSSLLRDLVLQLRPVSFLPGDVVVRRGDVGHQMYIIKCGECYVMSPDDKEVLATLGEGSVFGEISLLGIEGLRRRTATVRSRGYSSLFALSRNDLNAALKQHKEAANILRLRADQIIRENAARQVRQKLEREMSRKRSEDYNYRRRKSTVSGDNKSIGEGKKLRPPSAQSKIKLSAFSEINPVRAAHRSSLPKIVFSNSSERLTGDINYIDKDPCNN